jgi:hypothetical protein
MNQVASLGCHLADYGSGKVQVWFDDGLPEFAMKNLPVTISSSGYSGLNGTFAIKDISSGTGPAYGYPVLLLTNTWPGGAPTSVAATCQANYDLLPYDVYEAGINWAGFTAGYYYLKLTGTDPQLATMVAKSEPVEAAADLNLMTTPDHLQVYYKNRDNGFKVYYDTGAENIMRLEADLRLTDPGGEETVMEDSDRRLIKLNEYVTRMVMLTTSWIPSYLGERLCLALAHDTIQMNGIYYQKQDKPTVDRVADDDLVVVKVRLRQVEFIAENGDDLGSVPYYFGLVTEDGLQIFAEG